MMQDETTASLERPAESPIVVRQPPEDDYGWAFHWEDDVDSVGAQSASLVDDLPPQLHPAVSLGLQRVSSGAYLSIQGSVSEADLYSLASGGGDSEAHADWLYHDVIMHVLTFLDATSLAAFSETARRNNYISFYFLQLQLQRALLEDNLTSCLNSSAAPDDHDRLAAIAGSWTMSRLASMDKQEAQDVVQGYLDSNSTLRIMPLSHSLAYIRQVLRRNGFPSGQGKPQSMTTSAALLIGLVGAATVMSGNVNVEVVESFGTELPNMLFKVGFVGSLMGAARHGWESQNKARQEQVTGQNNNENDNPQSTMRETAEQMARTVQEMLQHVRMSGAAAPQEAAQQDKDNQTAQDGFFSRRMYDAFMAASGTEEQKQDGDHGPWGPNPYEHLPPRHTEEDDDEVDGEVDCGDCEEEKVDEFEGWNSAEGFRTMATVMSSSNPTTTTPTTKMPSGCVGAYFRAIQRASKSTTELVQKQRRERFEKLPNKDDVARTFIDACCSDETLDIVKNLVQLRSVIDASGFYVGSDGTETCALHASAFHGATAVLEFLCGGIDEKDPAQDQGLCSVDLQDINGWTALHFAAGANCVESARILAERGANLSVVAENGYTPLQWAQRLSNHEVAEELRKRLEQKDSYQASNHRWIAGASQPLSMIAHRFFSMIPTH